MTDDDAISEAQLLELERQFCKVCGDDTNDTDRCDDHAGWKPLPSPDDPVWWVCDYVKVWTDAVSSLGNNLTVAAAPDPGV